MLEALVFAITLASLGIWGLHFLFATDLESDDAQPFFRDNDFPDE
jgi:hypothetical protein